MTKQQIITELLKRHKLFVTYIVSLPEKEFMFSYNGKWTAGQQLDHIRRSVSPLLLAFMLPRPFIKLLFGKPKNISKSYDELVITYKEKLQNGGKATSRFVPAEIKFHDKNFIGERIIKVTEILAKKIDELPEEELDAYRLPHPLLGKLTIREMLYFTIYHVEHHHLLVEQNLKAF